jgi:hypothetical protein
MEITGICVKMVDKTTAEEHEVLAKSCREIQRHTDATGA